MKFSLTRRTVLVSLLLLCGLFLSGVAWYRLTRLTPESDPVAYWEMKGRQAYNRMPTVKVTQDNTDTLRDALDHADFEDKQHLLAGKEEQMLAPLRKIVIDFLIARYTASSPEEYTTWMQSHGYHFTSREAFEKRHGPLARLSSYSGTDSNDPMVVFKKLWEYPPAKKATPDAICTGPGSMIISVAKANANRGFTEIIAGSLGNELWMGASSGNCRMWLRPPVDEDELIKRQGSVLAAEVGCVVHVPHAPRRPIFVSLFFVPDSERWWIDDVLVTNHLGNDNEWSCSEF